MNDDASSGSGSAAPESHDVLAFGAFRFEVSKCRLYREGLALHLTPKAAAVLCYLLQRPGEIVSKDEFLDVIWEGLHAREESLTQSVSAIRRVIGDLSHSPEFIQTVPGVGYRFIGAVTGSSMSSPGPGPVSVAPAPPRATSPPTEPRAEPPTAPRTPRDQGTTTRQPGPPGPVAAVPPARGAAEATPTNPWKLAVPLAVASALLAAFGVWLMTPPMPEPLSGRFSIDYPPDTTFESTATRGVAISPDGQWVVFNADRRLWLRHIDDLVPRPIRGTEDARGPFFKPDSQQVGFWSDDQIKSVAIAGGTPKSLGAVAQRASGANWATNGFIYFGQRENGIWRVPENGGEPEQVIAMQEDERAHGPQLLPEGEWMLFTLQRGSFRWNDASIVAQRVSGEERQTVVERGRDARYLPTGHIVYSVDGDLVAVAFDVDTMLVTGGQVPVSEGVRNATPETINPADPVTGASQYAFSDSGALVYLPGGGASGLRKLVWVDRDDTVEPLPTEARRFRNPDLSPDGKRIAVEITGEDGAGNIWIYDTERGTEEQLTLTGDNTLPRWGPNGEWVFFSSDRSADGYRGQPSFDGNTHRDIWKRRADGTEDALLVLRMEESLALRSISREGHMLLFDSHDANDPARSGDIGILPLDGDQQPEMLIEHATREVRGSLSPDGRFFVFATNRGKQWEVYAQKVSGGGRFPVSTAARGGGFPFWSRDGKKIFYVSVLTAGILEVDIETEPFLVSKPREISDVVTVPGNVFAATDDGERFLVVMDADRIDAEDPALATPDIVFVLNGFEKLKRLAPTAR